jgi:hypothetical protein
MLKSKSITKAPSHQENQRIFALPWCPWCLGGNGFSDCHLHTINEWFLK